MPQPKPLNTAITIKLAFALLFFFFYFYSNSQTLNWAFKAGGNSRDESTNIHIDNAGNILMTGLFSGTVDFDPSAAVFNLTSAGSEDIFVAKYTSTGAFVWAFRIGGVDRDHGLGITCDPNNNVIVTGFFRGSNIDFDPSAATANLTSNGDAGADPGYGGDIFVAKYTSAGNYLWAFNVGGSELYDSGIAVVSDAASNIYVGGYFKGPVDFDPSAGTSILNSSSGTIFLSKYSSTGNYQWAFNTGLGDNNNAIFDLKTDNTGNVYVAGYFQGTNIDFDPSPAINALSSNGGYEIFFAKYTTNGQYVFAHSIGGAGNDVARGIDIDNNGNIYVIGDFNGTNIDFNPGAGTALLSSNGAEDVFLAKFTNAGNYVWAFNFGSGASDIGWKVSTDNSHLFVTGGFTGTSDMNPSAVVDNLVSNGGNDIFLGKYNLNGEYLCAFNIGGPFDDYGSAIRTAGPNIFYLTGFFQGTNVDFDPTATTFPLSSAGGNDIFLSKFTWPDNTPPNGTISAGPVCSGQQAQLVFNATAGTGPFTIVYNNGTSNITVNNVQSGVPFNITPNPTVTTTYTLVSIRDASRCSETRQMNGVTAIVIVSNCTVNCTYWPVFGTGNTSPIPYSNTVSFSYSNPGSLLANTAYSTMTPGNWFTPNPTIATTAPPNSTPHNTTDIGAITIFPTVVNNFGTISFASPTTTGFYLHVYQTVSRLDFDHSFSLISSDGDLQVGSSGSLVNNVLIPNVGPSQSPDDANATIYFPAGISQLKFTITSAPDPSVADDGIKLAFTFPDDCLILPCQSWLKTPSLPSYVNIGDLDVPGNQLTVEATVNRTQPYSPGTGNNNEGDIVSKHLGPPDVNYLLRPNHAYITTTNGFFGTPDICEIELNKTYHVAMVYDGNTLKFYRDGYLMSQVAATGNLFQNDLPTRIGLYTGITTENLIGYINEVRIWNVARSQAEIRAYMNTSLPNPPGQTGLLAYYIFNDLTNKQGNPLWNGTLGGSAVINQTNPQCPMTIDSCRVIQEQIINDYTPILSLDPCKNIINVGDASAFKIGDTVLMIQMKGAVIDSTNTNSFGTVINYKNAGNYEFNYIKSKNGNSIELLNKIERQYDLPEGKVQLIRVPYYQNYTVSNTNVLSCLPWNGSVGGVLVFNVQNNLTLNSNIDVSGKGFRGGIAIRSALYNCNIDSFYLANNNGVNGNSKGEGIYNTLKLTGRGKLANGGGGGNSANSGGGGGGNGGIGGDGGKQYVGGCNYNLTTIAGIGGGSLNYSNAQNKIFLGGGGGVGHEDDTKLGDGGYGGGIVIISASSISPNGFTIQANGMTPQHLTGANDDGRNGGGGGGTVLLNYTNTTGNLPISVKGGKGEDCIATPAMNLHGPGGGGGGGVVWVNQSSIAASLIVDATGGASGVNINQGNNPWGATAGTNGISLTNLVLPITATLFKVNIDSVRIKDSATGCASFDFKGLAYTNTSPISTWQWYFGDGGTSNTQNTTHTYSTTGAFTVKLVVTDINGCKDSITRNVTSSVLDFDFNYSQNVCNPLSVQFFPAGQLLANPYWSFGDGNTSSAPAPIHVFSNTGNYIVKYALSNGVCIDTVIKTISINIIPADIILTPDTTICKGTTKKLRTVPSLNFCWTPSTYLDNPNLREPTTSTPQAITYYYTAEVTGNNIIVNGDFSNGNTSFTSEYNYATPNVTEGQYYVGTNPQAWNASLSPCSDHTTGNGNMMLVNGSPTAGVNVWKQTVTVTPNTNYAFSTWIQALWPPNPAQLQFSINGKTIGNIITASLPTCTWSRFYTTWNSGNNTSAVISIVNINTQVQGNDFALDDISFAPVFIKRDSVRISVDSPFVRTNNDTTVCQGSTVQLNAIGSQSYSWSPSSGLSNSSIANPVATITSSSQYIVSGTSASGCVAKDTVNIGAYSKPLITTTNDTSICRNTSVQLFASGGINYSWSPSSTLSNPSIANPVATPTANTIYYVTVTDANTCTNTDSVNVSFRNVAQFSASSALAICQNGSVQLNASGGNIYSWSPASTLSNPTISNPIASPLTSTNYSVTITESSCNKSTTLVVPVTVRPLPSVNATRSNDVDCLQNTARLNATGAVSYKWTPAINLSNPNISNPIATPTTTTLYTVEGTDASGCKNTDTISVKVDFSNKNGMFLVPNAFTPNNDGLNDCFGIKHWGVLESVEFNIYNRWGELVFHTTDVTKCWDGKWKGRDQDPAVFVYWIKAKSICGGDVFRKGTVVLIR